MGENNITNIPREHIENTPESLFEETNTAADSEPVFYGTKEVAKMFRCSIPTAREIMRRADFPLLVFGGKWMVLKSALIKWASEKRI